MFSQFLTACALSVLVMLYHCSIIGIIDSFSEQSLNYFSTVYSIVLLKSIPELLEL